MFRWLMLIIDCHPMSGLARALSSATTVLEHSVGVFIDSVHVNLPLVSQQPLQQLP